MRKSTLSVLSTVTLLASAPLALAHPGHGAGVTAGLAHPLSGIDHIIAALAVGFWAMRMDRRKGWLIPAAFVATMVAAVLLPLGITASAAEAGVMASLFVLGLLAVWAFRMPLFVGIALTAVFAVFHGAAHSFEVPVNASIVGFALGLGVTTAVLCATGALAAIGTGAARQPAKTSS